MASLNKVMLIGRLGKDPEVKYTPNGAPVAKFSLATDESFKDKSGQQQKRTEWHNITAWNKLAEICEKWLHKGQQVYIEGKIQSHEWESDNGKRRSFDIIASQMVMLGGKSQNNDAAPSAQPTPEPSQPAEITDEDIPF